MENLIPVISRLQEVFQTAGERETYQLPQIVVVGAQSCGKSSVLENIVGRDFLPRGTGIVTRVPLVINLKRSAHNAGESDGMPREWAAFTHQPTKIYDDFEAVRDEIERRTTELTGRNKGISDQPITVTIHSPKVVNLTMVDLPGMTKVPVGDQPKDIEKQLRNLVLSYIRNPNSVILAVSAATEDIANSESLKIAKEIDPHGKRTLAVLTKLDLMDRGTDAKALLSGRGGIRVELGIVGIVNRGQQDILDNIPISDALEQERRFFAVNYPDVKHHCGTQYLSKTLNIILLNRIRDTLPDLKRRIEAKRHETAENLRRLGTPLVESSAKSMRILNALKSFADSFSFSLQGGSAVMLEAPLRNLPLNAGAELFAIFSHRFSRDIKQMDPLSGLTGAVILEEIKNTVGPRPVLFVPDRAFESLVKKQIQRLEMPCLDCVTRVHEKLKTILRLCLNAQDIDQFPELKDCMHRVAVRFVDDCKPEAVAMVKNLIAVELAYINTDHPQFQGLASFQEVTAQHTSPDAINDLLDEMDRGDALSMESDFSYDTIDDGDVLPLPPAPVEEVKRSGLGFSSLLSFGSNSRTSATSGSSSSSSKNTHPANSSSNSKNTEGSSLSASTGMLPDAAQSPMFTPKKGAKHRKLHGYHSEPLTSMRGGPSKDLQISLVRKLITSYFGIVQQTILDLVPKTITYFLINKIQTGLSTQLIKSLFKEDQFDRLLSENPEINQQRVESKRLLAAMDKAVAIISEIDDTAEF